MKRVLSFIPILILITQLSFGQDYPAGYSRPHLKNIKPTSMVVFPDVSLTAQLDSLRPLKVIVDTNETHIFSYNENGKPLYELTNLPAGRGFIKWTGTLNEQGMLLMGLLEGGKGDYKLAYYRVTYTYENGRIKSYTPEYWLDWKWNHDVTLMYYYDSDGRISKIVYEPYGEYIGGGFQIRYSYEGDSLYMRITEISEAWEDSAWVPDERCIYTYVNSRISSHSLELLDNDVLKINNKTDYKYDNLGHLIEKQLVRYFSSSIDTIRDFYTYNVNGLLTSRLSRVYRNNTSTDVERETFSYNQNQNPDYWLFEEFFDGKWTNIYSWKRTYNNDNKLAVIESFLWKNNAWIPNKDRYYIDFGNNSDTDFLGSKIEFVDFWTGINDNLQAAKEFRLDQNFPNPFNPLTHISYSIANAGHVQLKVFDVLGKEVTTLVDRFENAGEHRTEFNAAALSSGVYFYRITSGSYSAIKKMVLIK